MRSLRRAIASFSAFSSLSGPKPAGPESATPPALLIAATMAALIASKSDLSTGTEKFPYLVNSISKKRQGFTLAHIAYYMILMGEAS